MNEDNYEVKEKKENIIIEFFIRPNVMETIVAVIIVLFLAFVLISYSNDKTTWYTRNADYQLQKFEACMAKDVFTREECIRLTAGN